MYALDPGPWALALRLSARMRDQMLVTNSLSIIYFNVLLDTNIHTYEKTKQLIGIGEPFADTRGSETKRTHDPTLGGRFLIPIILEEAWGIQCSMTILE